MRDLGELIGEFQESGAAPVLLIMPSPQTRRVDWDWLVDQAWPAQTRVDTSSAVRDVVVPRRRRGAGSTRHAAMNEGFRIAAKALGVDLIDVEPYWLQAVAARGQDALFNLAQTVHANLLGHQLGYHAAIDAWLGALPRASSVDCSAAFDGNGTETPWNTVESVNAHTFHAGDWVRASGGGRPASVGCIRWARAPQGRPSRLGHTGAMRYRPSRGRYRGSDGRRPAHGSAVLDGAGPARDEPSERGSPEDDSIRRAAAQHGWRTPGRADGAANDRRRGPQFFRRGRGAPVHGHLRAHLRYTGELGIRGAAHHRSPSAGPLLDRNRDRQHDVAEGVG